VGLPVAAYLVTARLDGRDAGLVAGLVAIWLTAAIRKAATGSVPSLLTISAVVLTVQTAVVLATGDLWLQGNRQDQDDGVVAGLSAAEGQRALLDGTGDLFRCHVVQGGDEVAEAVVAVQAAAGRVAGLGDTVGEQHQAVAGSQQYTRVMQRGIGQHPEQGSRPPGFLDAPVGPSN